MLIIIVLPVVYEKQGLLNRGLSDENECVSHPTLIGPQGIRDKGPPIWGNRHRWPLSVASVQ